MNLGNTASARVSSSDFVKDFTENMDQAARYSCPTKNKIWELLQMQAKDVLVREPLLYPLIYESILKHKTLKEALTYRLASKLGGLILTESFYIDVFKMCLEMNAEAENSDDDFERLAMEDMIGVEQRDPACHSIATPLLYFKGFKAIQTYRLSHILWTHGRRDLAMVIQGRCTEIFGVDIHPGAVIKGGLMIDHGTGVVIGETCIIGKNCTLMHGITLGGTGTSTEFDRHPKIGDNCFLGCGVTVLGNIKVGDHSRIGAGSLVLKPTPIGSTAVGSPAKVISIDKRFNDKDEVGMFPPDNSINMFTPTAETAGSNYASNIVFNRGLTVSPSLTEIANTVLIGGKCVYGVRERTDSTQYVNIWGNYNWVPKCWYNAENM